MNKTQGYWKRYTLLSEKRKNSFQKNPNENLRKLDLGHTLIKVRVPGGLSKNERKLGIEVSRKRSPFVAARKTETVGENPFGNPSIHRWKRGGGQKKGGEINWEKGTNLNHVTCRRTNLAFLLCKERRKKRQREWTWIRRWVKARTSIRCWEGRGVKREVRGGK